MSTNENELLAFGPNAALLSSEPLNYTLQNAPVFTHDAFMALGSQVLPQRALFGSVIAQDVSGFPSAAVDRRLYVNSNAPFSAVVCGVQVQSLCLPLFCEWD